MGFVKGHLLILLRLIGAEGTKTPAGVQGQGRPRRSVSDEEAPGLPAESEVPGAEINH